MESSSSSVSDASGAEELTNTFWGVFWAWFLVYAAFRQHLFFRGWKGSVQGLHNRPQTLLFELHQAGWAVANLLFASSSRERACFFLGTHALGTLFSILAYSEWSKYTNAMLCTDALQQACALSVLFDSALPPPVNDWKTALTSAFIATVQTPALFVNNVYTGDVGSHRTAMERILEKEPELVRFVHFGDDREE